MDLPAPRFFIKEDKMLPKSIDVMGQKYKIKFVKQINFGGHEAIGLCDPNTFTIYLHDSLKQNKASLYETLGHEFIHGVIAAIGADQSLSHEMNEVLAQSIGRSIVQNLSFWKKLK